VKPDGTLLDKEAIPIATAPNDQALPDVAPGLNGFLVAWQDRRIVEKGYAVYAARVSPDGKVIDAGGVALVGSEGTLRGGSVRLAYTGSEWQIFRSDPYKSKKRSHTAGDHPEYHCRLRDENGLKVIGPEQRILGGWNRDTGVAAGGAKRAIYGNGGGKRGGSNPLAAVVDGPTGKILANPNDEDHKTKGGSGWSTKNEIVLTKEGHPGYRSPMAVGASGDFFLTVLRKGSDDDKNPFQPLCMMRIDGDGKKLDDFGNPPVLDDGKTPCMNPAVAGGKDGQFLVVYESDGGPGKHVVVARVVKAK
jgi:hypothetical protein